MRKINRFEWLKTAGVGLGILIILSLLLMLISVSVTVRIRTTEPYKYGVNLALQSPEVLQALGEPVTIGWLPQGNVNKSVGGDARLYIQLRGSKDNGTIRVNGTNREGIWKYYAIRVDTDQGEQINLLDPWQKSYFSFSDTVSAEVFSLGYPLALGHRYKR